MDLLTETPAYIKFSSMREYQVDGLRWMVDKYMRGLRGFILADEVLFFLFSFLFLRDLFLTRNAVDGTGQDVAVYCADWPHSVCGAAFRSLFGARAAVDSSELVRLRFIFFLSRVDCVPRQNEFERWCPDLRVVKYHGNKQQREAMKRVRVCTVVLFSVCLTLCSR